MAPERSTVILIVSLCILLAILAQFDWFLALFHR
jgi:hypothetical protein